MLKVPGSYPTMPRFPNIASQQLGIDVSMGLQVLREHDHAHLKAMLVGAVEKS
jgi:hypothetical protein